MTGILALGDACQSMSMLLMVLLVYNFSFTGTFGYSCFYIAVITLFKNTYHICCPFRTRDCTKESIYQVAQFSSCQGICRH